MAQELEDTTTDETLDESTETAEDTQPLELPTDPDELKKFAESAASEREQLRRERAQLQADRDRLKELEEEQRTKATYWATDAEAKAAELRRLQSKAAKSAPAKDAEKTDDDDEEIAILAANGLKLGDLRAMMRKEAKAAADAKATEVTQQGTHARQIVNDYPDLANDNSPLTKATIAEMEVIDREDPDLSDRAKFELATRRSAARLGIAPKSAIQTNGKSPEETERARRRAAQGGPTGKASPSKGTIVITDQDRAMARKMNNGQDMPDKLIIEAKKRLIDGQAARA